MHVRYSDRVQPLDVCYWLKILYSNLKYESSMIRRTSGIRSIRVAAPTRQSTLHVGNRVTQCLVTYRLSWASPCSHELELM